ncbi:glycosyltransferase family 4 protein [Alcanivorax nanhaiticus]|uniref:glycosyltransferase family 4 protein n=1 Tax=Alcanivorax nanhaiticus TaxID=1177154 RepID=UPI0005560DAE|nr:glycosyltransferase family 4 protein [Alcanivorax nanhaiticus]
MVKKRFLIIASYPDSLIGFRRDLIQEILDLGYEVHAAAPGISCDSLVDKKLISMGVSVHNIPMSRTGINPLKDLCSILMLCRVIKKTKSEYVLAYTVKPVIYGTLAAWFVGAQRRYSLITGLGYAFIGSPSGLRRILRLFIQSLYRFSLAKSCIVFFQNPDDEALFRDRNLLDKSVPSCVVNGSGVDVSEYCVTPLPQRPVFLLIARLLGDKGVREYAAAAEHVRSIHPEAKFLLVGWIDDNPDAIKKSELDSWVENGTLEFLGKLSDVRPAIAQSSVYVLPSYREGTPRTVLEAMAMGRAVITTDAPGCRETVVDGDNGFLVPVQNAPALADAMISMIESPLRVVAMGKRSREIAEEKYDVHKVNAVMLKEMGIS